MSTQPEGAGREAGGSLLPVPAPLAAKLRAAGRVAPAWYAAAVVALGAVAAVALVGVPAGLGLALLGVALCGLAAAHGTAPGAYTLTLRALAAALAAVPALRDADWVWIPSLVAAGMLASLAAAGGASGRQVVAGLTHALWRPLLGVAAVAAPLGRAIGRPDGARVRP